MSKKKREKETAFEGIAFDMPKNQSSVIKVIGVGGGGSNAINYMFQLGIKGVDFVVCNTDAQALENSPVPTKIQLGTSLTEGLGAGANPQVGKDAALESVAEIQQMLSTTTKMIFITAGMGGGTGTGAAPIIAKMAKDLDVLTVGIVTIPFEFEGKLRNQQAMVGVENLRSNVDSLIVINNNKLREVYGNLGFKSGFAKADEVLATAARGIAEVITHHYTQNIDLRDAKTVLADSGTAIMGSATATGANRASDAIAKALDSPLLNDNKITGAKNVLLLIVSGDEEITIDEIGDINDYIQDEAGYSANIIMGVGEEESLEGAISVTVIATGFAPEQQTEIVNAETKKIIHTLDDEQLAEMDLSGKTDTRKDKGEVIRHTLFDEDEEEGAQPSPKKKPFEGYVEVTDKLRSLPVVFDEVLAEDPEAFDQEEVNRMEVNGFTVVEVKDEPAKTKKPVTKADEGEKGSMLMFDMPLSAEKEMPKAQKSDAGGAKVTSRAKNVDVQDPVEVVPVTEVSKEGVKRYSLDDYDEQPKERDAKGKVAEEDPALEFKKSTTEVKEKQGEKGETDPVNASISDLLKRRTEERKQKMKAFNYKFKENIGGRVDEIERQPAYKRQGVDLEDNPDKKGIISRTSVSSDSKDDTDLRSNNSYLHDNVD